METGEFMKDVPAQPSVGTWRFVDELTTPLHAAAPWRPRRAKRTEAYLRGGVRMIVDFPDPRRLLATAFADFRRFLQVNSISADGAYPLRIERGPSRIPESFVLDVRPDGLSLRAGDTEGVRRGLVFLEDEMLRCGGPFLPLGRTHREPVVRTRISRCFFGPIKRPPANRDELADNVDYYPDEYLNRLAHDGVNGLWLTVEWAELCRTSVIPEFGRDRERRLARLRATVAKCAAYGVRVYVFCIEPLCMKGDHPAFRRHPELRGQRIFRDSFAVCTSSRLGRRHVGEAAEFLFSQVPGLGGMIVIPVGERGTHCCSGSVLDGAVRCPRCARRKPWQVVGGTLAAMERGMHKAAPQAELIAWPYGQMLCWGQDLTREAAGHVPPGVCLQHNFESGGVVRQLGRTRTLWDYWLSYIGPSGLFRDCARAAVSHGTRMFAKLQVGCSHEVATAPFVPVPGHLHGKYSAMHGLGVSGAMYSWYFGSYPSLMTRAAGELAWRPFPRSETGFLRRLAQRDWGRRAPEVVRAWRWFARAYRQYPHAIMVSYYGPMHDGPVWPLHLEPRDLPLAPTWKLEYPPSGDRIGEFITYSHTTREMQILFHRMAEYWDKGMRILRRIETDTVKEPERIREIGVARALGLQFRSGRNILRFYLLREQLPTATPARRGGILKELRALVKDELRIASELLGLSRADSRLGFHSEAEGYKYWPAKVEWRMAQLRTLLKSEFPRVARRIRSRRPLWPEWTGAAPKGLSYRCRRMPQAPVMDGRPTGKAWDGLAAGECAQKYYPYIMKPSEPLRAGERAERKTEWKAGLRGGKLYLGVTCREPDMTSVIAGMKDRAPLRWFPHDDAVMLIVEPRRLWPPLYFIVNARGARLELRLGAAARYDWRAATTRGAGGWSVTLEIPMASLGLTEWDPLRCDVARLRPLPGRSEQLATWRWARVRPWRYRLNLDAHNPQDLGWWLPDED